jgi:glycerol-3-phosphate dehydrogenase
VDFLCLQVAIPDVVEAAKEADILIFVLPHQFIKTLCSTLLGKIKPTAVGLSLIKVCSCGVHQMFWYVNRSWLLLQIKCKIKDIVFYTVFT